MSQILYFLNFKTQKSPTSKISQLVINIIKLCPTLSFMAWFESAYDLLKFCHSK